jgi:spore coat protein U-like protein
VFYLLIVMLEDYLQITVTLPGFHHLIVVHSPGPTGTLLIECGNNIPFSTALEVHYPLSEIMVKRQLQSGRASVILYELELTRTLTGNLATEVHVAVP